MDSETKIKTIGGVSRGAFPWWLLQQPIKEKSLVILSQEEDVLGLIDDFNALKRMPEDLGLTKFDIAMYAYPVDDEPQRQLSFHQWLFGKPSLLVLSQEAFDLTADTIDGLKSKSLFLKPGLRIKRNEFEDILGNGGYIRNDRADQVGEYAIRGDVIDIWLAGEALPLRLTWNFDTLEALRIIDLGTQRSDDYRREALLVPVSSGKENKLLTLFPQETPTFLYNISFDQLEKDGAFSPSNVTQFVNEPSQDEDFSTTPPPLFTGQFKQLQEQLKKWFDEDWKVFIFSHNQGERDRLEELLIDPFTSALGVKPAWAPQFIIGELEHGFLDSTHRLAILTNSEIFGRYRKRVRIPKFEGGEAFSSPLDIKQNDYLVHEKYGVGRYIGLRSLKVDKVTSEYLNLEYKGGDRVYVPIFEIQQVQKYLGAEGKRPVLSSLDTAAWERIKSKVKEDVAQLAKELLEKAAKRTIRPGYAFPPRTHLEDEFAASFMYKLTPDQEKTIAEVEQDMMSPRAMDRLICGDVGYGKTEVAMRAALKAALAAKQVALLCPTTILAEQHFRNFSERLADYPVTVKLLSRFQDKKNQDEVISQVANGSVDIIIGTHRLLSSDIAFKDLGLLIIDEEHRFGVKQKSQLLELRETVDVLSLTATPIPRTLASSLGGIKELSIIETPPEGRLPISTFVGVLDEDLVAQAVQKELDRSGQIFYVHNRVKTLLARQEWLQKILPGIRIGHAHGQMKPLELEKVMHDFVHKKVDVLLATTIIESGLDIPSVNTLIAEEAEELGLSQLYQLRGRVGRSAKRAYCYLFYTSNNLTVDAKKRLQALKEFTSLGSGIRLAMRDMEIRGAGNLLGPQQHGNMAAVGVETYSRLLNEEVQRLKGEVVESQDPGPIMELTLSAYIPEEYLPSETERVQMYKRILSADEPKLQKLKEELIDRCGALPDSAKTLFDTAGLRLLARKNGISEVHQEDQSVLLYFRSDYKMSDKSFNALTSQPKNILTLIPGPTPAVRLQLSDQESVLDGLGRFIRLVFSEKI